MFLLLGPSKRIFSTSGNAAIGVTFCGGAGSLGKKHEEIIVANRQRPSKGQLFRGARTPWNVIHRSGTDEPTAQGRQSPREMPDERGSGRRRRLQTKPSSKRKTAWRWCRGTWAAARARS